MLRDLDTDEVLSCADQPGYIPIAEGLTRLSAAERVYFHNGIRFDYPALRKVYPQWDMDRSKLRDTFTIACARYAHIKSSDYAMVRAGKFPNNKALIGGHTLEAWGYRLGRRKTDYKQWCEENGIEHPFAEWRKEMQDYCVDDTATGKAVVLLLRKSPPSQECIETEHALAWYLAVQERAGVPFDMEKAIALQAKLSARREQLRAELVEEIGPRLKRDGKPFTPKIDMPKKGVHKGCPYSKLKLVDFNPGSRDDIADVLQKRFGWIPEEYGDSGKPTVDDDVLEGFKTDNPTVAKIKEYLTVTKRLSQMVEGKQAWFRHARNDGPEGGKLTGLLHIHGRVKQNEAITHRAAHSSPNMSAVPKVGKPFGAECRELFYVPEGWLMVGTDASSLEARCCGHFVARYDGGAYGKMLLEGDVHTANRIALGLPEGKEPRDRAKTWYYAWLYGGGPEKLGRILDPSKPQSEWKKQGLKAARSFLAKFPALALLIEDVKLKAKQNGGWLTAIDGRRVYIRSDHSALNTLLQCAGALIVKKWIVNYSARLTAEFGEPGWTGKWVPLLWSHDETQTAVRPEIEGRVREIQIEEMRKLTDHFRWRVPLDGEAKVGKHWAATH